MKRRLGFVAGVLAGLLLLAANRPMIHLNNGDQAVYEDEAGTDIWTFTETGLLSMVRDTTDAPSLSLTNAGSSEEVQIIVGATDPSAGGGVAASAGSLYMRDAAAADGGALWFKALDAATGWTLIGGGGGGAHDILSATHTDTMPSAVSRGSFIRGGVAAWEEYSLGAAGTVIRSDGTDILASVTTWPNALTAGDTLVATAANVTGVVADVAVGQVFASGGVGVVPAWTATPSLSGTGITFTGLNQALFLSGYTATGGAETAFNFRAPTGYGSADNLLIVGDADDNIEVAIDGTGALTADNDITTFGVFSGDYITLTAPAASALSANQIEIGTTYTWLEGASADASELTINWPGWTNAMGDIATTEAVVYTKTDTGDPAFSWEGLFVINTFDNNVKVYADGAYRTLASGW